SGRKMPGIFLYGPLSRGNAAYPQGADRRKGHLVGLTETEYFSGIFDGLDHIKDGHAQGEDQLHEGTGQKTQEGTKGSFDGRLLVRLIEQFPDKGADKGPDDDAQWSEQGDKNSHQQTNGRPPHPCFAAPELLGAHGRDHIIQDRYQHGQKQGNAQHPPISGDRFGQVEEQQPQPTDRWAGQNGQKTAEDTDKYQDKDQNEYDDVHGQILVLVKDSPQLLQRI